MEAGTRLGPYEILARIGAGGMGEVWRARDPRLSRDVAIKVLPAEFAADAKLKIRFEREARAISQLEHPHICRVYDVGPDYMVMELLDGRALNEIIERGPLPLKTALTYGAEIAEALAGAHRASIVHRDVKPGNVMITRSGAKLVDFGLAKPDQLGVTSGTMTLQSLTEEGAIVGTLHYMAPEQIEGGAVDSRTDIFALGAVLYEMLTGKRPFEQSSRAGLLAEIVHHEPRRISELQPAISAAVERAVSRCLAKAPDDRWQSAADLAAQLRWLANGEEAAEPSREPALRQWPVWAAGVLAAAVIVGAVTIAVRSARRADADIPDTVRFTIPVIGSQRFQYFSGFISVAPDGKSVVYSSETEGELRLFSRRLDSGDAVPIRGTNGAHYSFFSPDGKWIAFFANHKLLKVPAAGGDPLPIAEATTQPRGGDWGDDGSILYGPFAMGGFMRLTAGAIQAAVVTPPIESASFISGEPPQMLPGSAAFLYTILAAGGRAVVAQRVDTGERRTLVAAGYHGRYISTGHLVFQRGESLYAVRFDPKELTTHGEPVLIVDGVSGEFAISPSGNLLAYIPPATAVSAGGLLQIVDRSGRPVAAPAASQSRNVRMPVWSRDGSRIVSSIKGRISVLDLVRGTWTALGPGSLPAWSPDGKRVMYRRGGAVVWRAADASDAEHLVFADGPRHYWPISVSADGVHVLLGAIQGKTSYDLYVGDLSSGEVRPLVVTPFDEGQGSFSPDGKWITYMSDESGRNEVYVSTPDGAARWQISSDGGDWPVWRSAREIVYRSGSKIMSVEVSTTPAFSAAAPRMLFERWVDAFDVSSDGQRLVIVERRDAGSGPERIEVVANFRQELEKKVGKR